MTRRRSALLIVVVALIAFFARSLRADDLADEADLHFRLATEKYATRDFRGALEHFLVSNRLVPNRNVIFNIARTYEQLQEYPDAFRYYVQALDLEPDASRRPRIEEAIARIQPNVAVINVTTDPPGATVYINRRDLGPRGNTPRLLGFPAGTYKVIVDLEGYEPAEVDGVEAKIGEQKTISLKLERIVGKVHIVGETAGSVVRVDDPNSAPACTAPCDLTLPPGRHRLYLHQPGFSDSEQDVTVSARGEVTARYRLNPMSGSLVVNADERDALVEVDGKPMGFTPAVLAVQSGPRKVRVSLRGFRTVEQSVNVLPNQQTRLDVSLRQLEEVEAASRTAEAVEDAPGSVTIIPAQELRAMGYSTIAEAIRGIRGLYMSDDHTYATVGIRGIAIPGDQGNKNLVLLNGVPTTDSWANLAFLDFSARADLDDVERIEIVRGPGSVLYGTGAFSGVINVVTRGRPTKVGGSAGIATSDNRLMRGHAMAQIPFGRDSGMWISIGAGRSLGTDVYLKEAVTPTFDGYSRDADYFNVGTVQGRLFIKSFSMQWFLTSRSKALPTGFADTALNTDASRYRDTRGFIEAKYEPRFSDKFAMSTRAVLNYDGFRGTDLYATPDMGYVSSLALERFNGMWAVGEQRFIVNPIQALRITAGAEGQVHFMAEQRGEVTDCPPDGKACDKTLYLPDLSSQGKTYDANAYDKHPYQIVAGYALVDVIPSDKIRVSAGARYDYYVTFKQGSGISPRIALIAKPYEQGNLKLMVGRAFRAPTYYERFYELAGFQVPSNGHVTPETVWSGEAEFTHRFSTTVSALGAAYVNYLSNLIETVGDGSMGNPVHYQNSGVPVMVVGGEAELKREWRQGWMAALSYSYAHARFVDDTHQKRKVPNSPEHMGSFRGAVPLFGRAVTLATRLTIEAPRYDTNFNGGDPPQGHTDPALVWDLVLSGDLDRGGLHYNVGVYNIADWHYTTPASPEYEVRQIPQNGRTFLASGSVNF